MASQRPSTGPDDAAPVTGLWRGLFDFGFRRSVAERIARIGYGIAVVVLGLMVIASVVCAGVMMTSSPAVAVVTLVAVPPAAFVVLLGVRMMLELVVMVVRAADDPAALRRSSD